MWTNKRFKQPRRTVSIPKHQPVFIVLYSQEQMYGGPEEGGWWYWWTSVEGVFYCGEGIKGRLKAQKLLPQFQYDMEFCGYSLCRIEYGKAGKEETKHRPYYR